MQAFETSDLIEELMNKKEELRMAKEQENAIYSLVLKDVAAIQHGALMQDLQFSSPTEQQIAVSERYKKEIDEADQKVKNILNQMVKIINSISSRIYISNYLLSELISVRLNEKWVIVEGGEIWEKLSTKCKLTGLYAVSEKSKHYKIAYQHYKTQKRLVQHKGKNQFDYDYTCLAPITMKSTDNFIILNENSDEYDFLIESIKKDFINTNWIGAYLVKLCGLSASDLFEVDYFVRTPIENNMFGNLIFSTISEYLQQIRENTFVLL